LDTPSYSSMTCHLHPYREFISTVEYLILER